MFVMRTRKRGTMALLVLQTKDVPMNTLAAKVSRQRHLFARFASVCVLVALALLLLPVAAHADGYSMTQTYISATVEADGSLTVVEGRQFDFDDDINGVFWEINTGSNQQGGTAGVDVLSVEEEDTAFNKVDSANKATLASTRSSRPVTA